MAADASDKTVAKAKATIRRAVLARRTAMDPTVRHAHSAAICARLLGLREVDDAAHVLAYRATGSEVDVDALAAAVRARGSRTSYPRVDGKHLVVIAVDDTTAFVPGYRAIDEPVGEPQPGDDLDVIVVPGVAFDLRGHRIGHGLGFYDRFLASRTTLRIGVAFDEQIIDGIPVEPFDASVDLVVTPTRTIRV
ncbi:MAG: 5-formyltetrahydrofolate cyclo-ligase [Nitriliruptoraceae bacterium]